jgi:hypothetical protein
MEKEKFTTIPQCLECYHYIKYDGVNFKCEAYPEGIPEKLLRNEIKHYKIVEVQKGDYTFKPKIIPIK